MPLVPLRVALALNPVSRHSSCLVLYGGFCPLYGIFRGRHSLVPMSFFHQSSVSRASTHLACLRQRGSASPRRDLVSSVLPVRTIPMLLACRVAWNGTCNVRRSVVRECIPSLPRQSLTCMIPLRRSAEHYSRRSRSSSRSDTI